MDDEFPVIVDIDNDAVVDDGGFITFRVLIPEGHAMPEVGELKEIDVDGPMCIPVLFVAEGESHTFECKVVEVDAVNRTIVMRASVGCSAQELVAL